MIVDGLVNAIVNLIMFSVMILFIKKMQSIRKKNYTPAGWISIDKNGIKLLFLGMFAALFYKSVVGLIGIISGTMIFTINQASIIDTLIFMLASCFGYLGVALFEEGLFRGYMMQVILRRMPILLAIIIQAVVFGLIHYSNYSGQPHALVKILDAILIGLIFGIIVVKMKSIMLVIGFHLMNNVAEEILFLDKLHVFNRAVYFQKSNFY